MTSYADFKPLTFHDAARTFGQGPDSPRAYLERCLETIARREPVVKAFTAMNETGARAAADQSSARWKSGKPLSPIDGMPMGVKDVIETDTVVMRSVTGTVRWVRAESVPRDLPDGSTVWEGVLIDITAQRRALQQLEEERTLLNTVLGGSMSSRLFQSIREKQGLVYNIASELSLYRDSGAMAIYAGTSPGTLRRVVTGVMHELRGLKNEPVTADELRRAKDNLKASVVLGLESASSRMSNLARQEQYRMRLRA